MRDATPNATRLENYAPPPFLIDRVDLDVDLFEQGARVRARLAVRRNPLALERRAPLVLDADELEFVCARLNGDPLSAADLLVEPHRLTIADVPDAFSLEIENRIRPRANTKLSGLYAIANGFVTQCEAEGFRRITYFLDRPDVMARYTCTIHAERQRYPVLLANGNLVEQGDEPGGRHWAKWDDPFPKPSYLFALVAAQLDVLEDRFVTASGREVQLAVYVEPGKLDQCGFAMEALQRAMRWDEQVFGLELDLDRYMIVAVGDFNAGAMENKGLNIFNTRFVLARPDTATDDDFQNIDRVVAHEYFHNWTGNRVTCRDWFQLSLKEGLTVFRDQEYGADTTSRAVTRIQDVRDLRARQFPEDAGPMAHPVRPASYIEIGNFYTATVYEKGAEVVRMIHGLIGAAAFRRGMDLYFARHDGQAVTCDDFVRAMEEASGADLAQFRRWYAQAGTPVVEAHGDYDAPARRYVLTLRQSCPPTPDQPEKLPLHIPVAIGLVGPDGADLPLRLAGEPAAGGGTRTLSLVEAEQRFVFEDVAVAPVPSLLRGFSAPVTLRSDADDAALTHLMAHDSDAFNRWEAGQRLAMRILLRAAEAVRAGGTPEVPSGFVAACARVLREGARDPAFAAEALGLPDAAVIAEEMAVADPEAIHAARIHLRRVLAQQLEALFEATYAAMTLPGPYRWDAQSAGRRALRNACLGYLVELDTAAQRARALRQFEGADNMTDALAALAALAQFDCAERDAALDAFYRRWRDEPLVVDKWFAVQATSRRPDTLDEVRGLTRHPAFDIANPNKVYALIRAFCGANHLRFHAADGAGYAFAADQVIALDGLNPSVAARVARAFDRWRKFDDGRQRHARAALERIRDHVSLSRDVFEIVTRALA